MEMGVTVHYNLIRIKRIMPNRIVESYGNFVVLTTCMRVAGPRQVLLKRTMDIVGSLVGLFLMAIAFLIFAPVIKIQSPGPIFSNSRESAKTAEYLICTNSVRCVWTPISKKKSWKKKMK